MSRPSPILKSSPSPLWQLDHLCAAMGAPIPQSARKDITGVSIDSRTLSPGEVFFAIKGDRFDGHDFVDKALGAGAACAVVARARVSGYTDHSQLVVVDDVLAALEALAQAARARCEGRVIAITGSAGKTTTKHLITTALAPSGRTHAARASFNNHWGVPLSLARMPEDADYGIFEIGMNHAGEITPLVQLVRPHVAIVTTVDAAHLAHFNSVEDIARAKAEIFLGLEPEGIAILNMDNPHYLLLESLAKKAGVKHMTTFGGCPLAQNRLIAFNTATDETCVKATIDGETVHYKLGLTGRHQIDNSLASLAAVKAVGGDLARAMLALATVRPPHGRGRQQTLHLGNGQALLIDESYNANPASMRAALRALGDMTPGGSGRRIAVLGDMLELGAQADALHTDLAQVLEDAHIDRVFLVGPHMRALWQDLEGITRGHWTAEASEIAEPVFNELQDGDIVMIKGSLGTGMKVIVEALTHATGKETLCYT